MYRAEVVQSKLLRVVGWRQNDDQQDFQLDKPLLTTESGKVFQQAHALLTLQNLKAIAPNFDNYLYGAWADTTEYLAGSIVTHNFRKYIAKVDNKGEEPSPTPPDNPDSIVYWEAYNPMSNWLDTKVKDSINTAIGTFLDNKLSECANKSLVENKILFDGAGRLSDVDTYSSGIAGFEIVPIRSRSITCSVNRVGLQFNTEGAVTIGLYHSGTNGVVKSYTFDYDKPGSVMWFATDMKLPYVGTDTDAGGSWYIVYSLDTLSEGMHPVVKSRDWSSKPCASCDSAAPGFNLLSKYVEVYPFNAKSVLSEDAIWDISHNVVSQYNNFGLNLDMSVECDMTDFIVSHRKQFSNIILYQFAVDMLREMCYNPNTRINRNSLIAQRSELIFALEGDSQAFRKSGLSYTLQKAYEAVETDLDGIDKTCLPKKNGGLKYRTI